VSLQDSYVKINLISHVEEDFVCVSRCSCASFINDFHIGEKVLSTGSFLDKKYSRRGAVYDGVLDPKLESFTDEVWSHLSGFISDHNNRYWSITDLRQTFEGPFTMGRLVCDVPLLLHS
jgi:hypothetical protein